MQDLFLLDNLARYDIKGDMLKKVKKGLKILSHLLVVLMFSSKPYTFYT